MGIGLAVIARLVLLLSIFWVMGLVEPWFTVFGQEISGRDLILIVGGLFLLAKSTHEIHNALEVDTASTRQTMAANFATVLVQIAVLDIVFSLDSVITAVGLVEHISIMVVAILTSVFIMLLAAKPIGDFVDLNPTVKMLALAFLILIGVTLIAEDFDVRVPKGYIYFAMAFSIAVELLNMQVRKRRATRPLTLQKRFEEN